MNIRTSKATSKKIDDKTQKKYEEESVEITQMLLLELSKQFMNIPKIMVNCSIENSGPNSNWEAMAKKANFIPIAYPAEAIKIGLQHGEDLLNLDGAHWNSQGNMLFGETLYWEMKKLGLIKELLASDGH